MVYLTRLGLFSAASLLSPPSPVTSLSHGPVAAWVGCSIQLLGRPLRNMLLGSEGWKLKRRRHGREQAVKGGSKLCPHTYGGSW